jgi:hypothetical protein
VSRTLAVVLAAVLLFPIVACMAAFSAAGVNSAFMTNAITFAVVVGGAIAAVVEIRRLIEA